MKPERAHSSRLWIPLCRLKRSRFRSAACLTIAGVAVGFTFGIMLALLQGGLVRMQQNPVTKDKLDLLKRSLWKGRAARPKHAKEEVTTLQHARPEATS